MTDSRPERAGILAGLKPFQRATVDHAFRRLWTDPDRVDRFLVADEVGLGKTLVAKGIAARAIDHLRDTGRPITIVYICSNGQIARQNLRRLRDLTGGEVQDNADRLTLLPAHIGRATASGQGAGGGRVNLVAFTPGTSLQLGQSTGQSRERALLHWMLRQVLGNAVMDDDSWTRYLAVSAGVKSFAYQLTWDTNRPPLDPALMDRFRDYLTTTPGPHGGTLLEDLREDHARWARTQEPTSEMWHARSQVIGALRMAMATVSVERLDPDLVILDEFQRFKDLFPVAEDAPSVTGAGSGTDVDPTGGGDGTPELSEAQRLAHRVITAPNAKALVLSATPYKMYTLPDEPTGDDHLRDFTHTISFLTGPRTAERITRDLATLREGILRGGETGMASARRARQDVEAALRRVMSRTERLAATPNRDGMLEERTLGPMTLEPGDLRGWLGAEEIATVVGAQDPFEFWRAAPYTTSLMDRTGYQVQERFLAAVDKNDAGLAAAVCTHPSAVLDWEGVRSYRPLELPNAKMRALVGDLVDHGAHRMAWLAPSLPYVEPGGVYADEKAQRFTKRLVFSAWKVVPKAVATLVSYEAERRLRESSAAVVDQRHQYGDRRTVYPLTFDWDGDQDLPRSLPLLTVLYPSVRLAQLGDPLALAAEHGWELPMDRDAMLAVVAERIRQELEAIGVVPQPGKAGLRRRWYGVAPYLLDRALDGVQGGRGSAAERLRRWTTGEQEGGDQAKAPVLVRHMEWALGVDLMDPTIREALGEPPEDLPEVLALMALAGPGVCALRALARQEDGIGSVTDPDLRVAAVTASKGLRSLFNKPEVVSAVRGAAEEAGTVGDVEGAADDQESDPYWRQVLRYSLDGNLQAVLDEFAHTLVESEGLGHLSTAEQAETIAGQIQATASIRAASNEVLDVRLRNGRVDAVPERMHSHVGARFGRAQSTEAAVEREAGIREGYTSPFWPFVLASTSVGQEGLDFHTYSHAVVHWNLPGNPVDLEQREGRVHRYKGHAVRKNVAAVFRGSAVTEGATDPWAAMFCAAERSRGPGDALINPYWVFPLEGGAVIERYVPAMPLSQEAKQYERLLATLGAYRSVMGQPRQQDLLRYLSADPEALEQLQIDLSPPSEP